MAKQHKENVRTDDVPRAPWRFPPVPEGIEIRVLNEDGVNGALTALLDIPAGWEWSWQGYNRAPQELFLCEGLLRLGATELGPGYYSYYPPGTLQGGWRAERDCTVYALFDARPEFVESSAASAGAPQEQVVAGQNTWAMEWINPLDVTEPDVPFRAGAFVKTLRVDEETKASTYLAGLMPGWYCEGVEYHPVGEEEFTLCGDLLLGEVAGGYTLGKGSYFCRPPGVRHGPLVTKNGVVIICHPTGRLEINYETRENAQQVIDDYLAETSWA